LKKWDVIPSEQAHNPSALELLDLCDKMGFLVQVEAFD